MSVDSLLEIYIKNNDYTEMIKKINYVNQNGQNLLHLMVILKKAHKIDWLNTTFPRETMVQLYNQKDNFGKQPWEYGGFHWRNLSLEA